MSEMRIVAAALAVFIATGTVAFAQGLSGPVNLPPSSFDGQQFNDNAGCAFMRAGVSGSTVWVPRVNQDREPICDLAPTFAVAAPVVAEAAIGEPPAPVVAEMGAPLPTVATLTTAPRIAATPVAAPVVVAAPVERRMTLAQVCAETAATGRVFTDSATGQPVVCPNAAPAVLAEARPASVAASVVGVDPPRMKLSNACAMSQRNNTRYIDASTGQPLDCTDVAPTQDQQGADIFGNRPLPASNPTGAVPAYTDAPAGYEPVWTDDRLNPHRGFIPVATSQYQTLPHNGRISSDNFIPLSREQMAARVAAPVAADRVSTQNVAIGHRFVQVGTYGDPANADRAAAALRGLGLPVGLATLSRNGAALQIVAAGPFGSASELQAALQAARASGFGDAFTRS